MSWRERPNPYDDLLDIVERAREVLMDACNAAYDLHIHNDAVSDRLADAHATVVEVMDLVMHHIERFRSEEEDCH